MKKAFVVTALLFCSATFAQESILDSDARISDGVSMGAVTALSGMIRLNGYSCDTVSAVTPFAMSRGFHVTCNNWQYSYEVADHGGKWAVTVDD